MNCATEGCDNTGDIGIDLLFRATGRKVPGMDTLEYRAICNTCARTENRSEQAGESKAVSR